MTKDPSVSTEVVGISLCEALIQWDSKRERQQFKRRLPHWYISPDPRRKHPGICRVRAQLSIEDATSFQRRVFAATYV
jgi:hypothetical protein